MPLDPRRYFSREPRPLRERILEKIEVKGPDECWPWLAYKEKGYGRLTGVLAHRFVLEEKLGRRLKEGMDACHSCDNRGCCNPAHLFEGTRLVNIRDAVSKGRIKHGSRHARTELTEEQIIQIRIMARAKVPHKAITKLFGIQSGQISKIKHGYAWKHTL